LNVASVIAGTGTLRVDVSLPTRDDLDLPFASTRFVISALFGLERIHTRILRFEKLDRLRSGK
jgi:hypothetical protein